MCWHQLVIFLLFCQVFPDIMPWEDKICLYWHVCFYCYIFSNKETIFEKTEDGIRRYKQVIFLHLQVFPDLREWCEKRRLHLVECDLRWVRDYRSHVVKLATVSFEFHSLNPCKKKFLPYSGIDVRHFCQKITRSMRTCRRQN